MKSAPSRTGGLSFLTPATACPPSIVHRRARALRHLSRGNVPFERDGNIQLKGSRVSPPIPITLQQRRGLGLSLFAPGLRAAFLGILAGSTLAESSSARKGESSATEASFASCASVGAGLIAGERLGEVTRVTDVDAERCQPFRVGEAHPTKESVHTPELPTHALCGAQNGLY